LPSALGSDTTTPRPASPDAAELLTGATTATVGIWRLFDLVEELKLPLAHNTNSLLYDYAPQIFARIVQEATRSSPMAAPIRKI